MSVIATIADAESALDHGTRILDTLLELLEREITLVRAGHIKRSTELAPTKSQLAGELFSFGQRLKANAQFLQKSVPTRCAAFQLRQEAVRTVLQKNMIVLATTHAVSEGIVRRLSGDLARKAAPQVYGASGRSAPPHPRHNQPLALSRTL